MSPQLKCPMFIGIFTFKMFFSTEKSDDAKITHNLTLWCDSNPIWTLKAVQKMPSYNIETKSTAYRQNILEIWPKHVEERCCDKNAYSQTLQTQCNSTTDQLTHHTSNDFREWVLIQIETKSIITGQKLIAIQPKHDDERLRWKYWRCVSADSPQNYILAINMPSCQAIVVNIRLTC